MKLCRLGPLDVILNQDRLIAEYFGNCGLKKQRGSWKTNKLSWNQLFLLVAVHVLVYVWFWCYNLLWALNCSGEFLRCIYVCFWHCTYCRGYRSTFLKVRTNGEKYIAEIRRINIPASSGIWNHDPDFRTAKIDAVVRGSTVTGTHPSRQAVTANVIYSIYVKINVCINLDIPLKDNKELIIFLWCKTRGVITDDISAYE